jgi:hypothetical protein
MTHEFQSTDLYACAYLIARGYQLQGVEWSGHRCSFVFSIPVEELTVARREWLSGAGMVSGLAFANAVRQLKAAVHTRD